MVPSSIYRLQLHPEQFRLRDAIFLIPYLSELGLEGVCTSPLFESVYSGYDVTNPNRLNPALGTMEEFEEFCQTLKKHNMAQILDVVPNHMGIKGVLNHWWLDVLEKGRASKFARFFDINWKSDIQELKSKVLLPILGDSYEMILKNKELRLEWNRGFWIRYFDYLLPLSYASYRLIVNQKLPSTKERFLSGGKVRSFETQIARFNQDPKHLQALLEKQHYLLSFWKDAGEKINYRRFFNINELIGVQIEKASVLQLHHQWVFELIRTKKVQGLRIDHPDGLLHPKQYFERIIKRNAKLIFAEKILSRKERLPKKWNISGTVGYDFLSVLSSLFVNRKSRAKMTDIYHRFIGKSLVFRRVLYDRKKRYIQENGRSEIRYLAAFLKGVNQIDLEAALIEVMANFPVYRTYILPKEKISSVDREYVNEAINASKKSAPQIDPSIFDSIQSVLLLEGKSSGFTFRFQQRIPATMAKGLEDSTFYYYNRLISLNEVGGAPDHFGSSGQEFHAFNRRKLKDEPFGMLASSTHDTKFSEDVRLRIHAITEMPEKWERLVSLLERRNRRYKTNGFPEPNMEYFLYQILIGVGPNLDSVRLWDTLKKAIRENGEFSSWRSINSEYEEAARRFLFSILPNLPPLFFTFQKAVDAIAKNSSLCALILKVGSCGIVDLYQGNEQMNYRLVDPDNRRPVDFESNRVALREKKLKSKIRLTQIALSFRREHKDLFLQGAYKPIKSPPFIIAFMRVSATEKILVCAKRHFREVGEGGALLLPQSDRSSSWQDLFTKQKFQGNRLSIKKMFKTFPFALLVETSSVRGM